MNKKQDNLLVIGYGNTLRSDDGVGQIVAKEVEKLLFKRVKCIYQHQLTPELAEEIKKVSHIIFIDACINDTKVKNILLPRTDINNIHQIAHYCTPEYLLYLNQIIYNKYPQSWLISIPISNLNLGDELSFVAKEGAKIALQIIKKIINTIE